MHPFAHIWPFLCCAAAAVYLARLIWIDMRSGLLPWRWRDCWLGVAYVVAATIAAGISAFPVVLYVRGLAQ
jgi:hypothetical protein